MSRVGIDRNTGVLLLDWAECAQSSGVIISTAVGTLVLARDFGSSGPALQDAPMNTVVMSAHYMAIAEALRQWEPGYRLVNISIVQANANGEIAFLCSGNYYPNALQGDFSVVETGREVIAGPFSTATLQGLG